MFWELAPNFDAAFRAALTAGKSLIYVCPPTWWTTLPLFVELPPVSSPGTGTVVIIPDATGLRECGVLLDSIEQFRPVHPATGLTRAGRMLRARQVTTLVSTPGDLLSLLTRSSLEMGGVQRIVIAWPELHTEKPASQALDTILAEGRETQRIIITADPQVMTDFLERHARRAPTFVATSPTVEPSGSARYAVTDPVRAPDTLWAALDTLNPASVFVWDPLPRGIRGGWLPDQQPGLVVSEDPRECDAELAIAMELPTPDVLAVLQERTKNVLLVVRAFQIPFARAMLTNLRVLRLPSEADRAHDRAFRLRKEIRDQIAQTPLTEGFLALSALFDEHDPATVAAALLSRLSIPKEDDVGQADVPTWVRIRVDAGARNRIRTGDVVGALLNAVEIPKDKVGRVDVRDGYSLVEVQADVADKAVKGLHGLLLRGNRLAARLDRH